LYTWCSPVIATSAVPGPINPKTKTLTSTTPGGLIRCRAFFLPVSEAKKGTGTTTDITLWT
jgi:hypothetical protein